MQTSSTADVTTDRPARFGKQLVSHLGRHGGGEWDDRAETGWVQLGLGRAELTCSASTLHLRVDGEPDVIAQLEDVVGRHLVRFDAKDELVVGWTRADGSPGSQQTASAEG